MPLASVPSVLHLVAVDVVVAAAVDVEIFLVGREGEAVDHRHVLGDQRELAVLPHVDGVEIELLAGVLVALAVRAVGVGEIDGAVALDDDVVGAAEALALVAVGEHGALAVLLDAHQRAAREGGEDQPALAIER